MCEHVVGRGLFYVACKWAGAVAMLELGSASASHFEQHAKLLHGGMKPGLVFRLKRSGAKQPIYAEVVREQALAIGVPILVLAKHVMSLYKFPPPNPADSIETYERRCRAVAEVRCSRAAQALLVRSENQASQMSSRSSNAR
jgi:hypothetical protein